MNALRFSKCKRVGITMAVAWIAVACGDSAPPPSIAPSISSLAGTSTIPPPPPLSPEDMDEAAQFRSRYGLRADDAWILAVARADAARAGIEEFGVPLMPFEIHALHARRTDRDVLRQIGEYGDIHSDQYAGAYVDQRQSMGFVVMFTGSLERHRTTLAGLLPEGVHLDPVLVRWSTRELDAFQAHVEADLGWTGPLGVRFLTAGRRITEDVVYVRYFGPEEAASSISDYYGNPPWLAVERDGPLPWLGPRGDLVIDVVDAHGGPMPGVECGFRPLDPDAEEGGAMPYGTDERGRCILRNLPAVRYEITLSQQVADDRVEVRRRLEVALPPGGRLIRVQLDR